MTISLAGSASVGATSTSYTVVGVGNLIAVLVDSGSATNVTAVTDSNSRVSWNSTAASAGNLATGNVIEADIWYGTTTSTGATTISFTGPTTGTDLVILELHSTLSTTWSVVAPSTPASGFVQNNSTTYTWASLTSGTATDQAYVGIMNTYNTASSGTTSGFTYTSTANGGRYIYDLALAASTLFAPSTPVSPAGQNGGAGAIFAAGSAGPVSASATALTGLTPDIPVSGDAAIGPGPNLTIVAFDL